MRGVKQKCKVIVHGRRREIPFGTYDSMAEAKRGTRFINQPISIIKLEDEKP